MNTDKEKNTVLIDLRRQIDKIDDAIAKLYVERMATVKEIASVKNERGQDIKDVKREKEIINRVTGNMQEEYKLYTKELFSTIMNTSKAYQSQFVNTQSHTKQLIIDAENKGFKDFPVSAVVACQGVFGSYSSLAVEKIFKISNIMYFKTWEAVFNAVENNLCEYGVLPIENSSVGSVNAVYDLIKKHKCYIVRSIKLKIQHHLLANKGTNIKDIKEVYSHEQALGQCTEFLKKLKEVKVTLVENTAVAAEEVRKSGRKDLCCIASRECGEIYGLSILESNIQDSDSNYTRFIAISKNMDIFKKSNKISIMVTLSHEPGSLNKLLTRFAAQGLNLTKIESRPIVNMPFEFAFYFDFEADIERKEVKNLLAEIESTSPHFVFLGSYCED